MKNTLLLFLLLLPHFAIAGTNKQKLFEIPRTQVVPIQDTVSGRQYELYMKLPDAYAENKDKKYPVIYFTDAVWHIELLSATTEFLMEDAILVGISWQKDIDANLKKEVGAHVSRYRDYTVIQSNNAERQAKYQFGQATKHLEFIRKDVIQYVENNYRTDPSNRTYFGYSAGGLFGAFALLSQPGTFKNYMLGSPSVDVELEFFSELASNPALKNKDLDANVFITYGTLEEDLGKHIEEFISLLKGRKDASLSLKHVLIEGTHQTAFPSTGVRAVTWLADITKNKE